MNLEINKSLNDKLRKDSGEIDIDSKLVSFLYDLMRDHVPPSTLERLVREAETESDCQYSNGWLALYAQNLALRLGVASKIKTK